MRRPRHLGRWIGGGAALAAFVTVATAISSAGAGTVPSRAKPHQPAANLGIVHGANTRGAIPDSYIVGLKNASVSAAAVDSTASTLAAKYGGTVSRTYSHALRGFAAQMTASQAKALAANPAVAFVEQNRTAHVLGSEPNPPSWGIDRIDQSALPTDNGYTFPNTASNVHAYVIDTGIHVTHEQFAGRATFGTNTIDTINDDCFGHGTHVAGTIGGTTTGVAKQIQLVAVKVLDCTGNGTEASVIAGIDWVTAHGVKPAVANMSLGFDRFISTGVDTAVKNSIAAGITYSIAAGNSNVDACTGSPADVTDAIVVGATDESDFRASFSNFGSCLDVFAPGVDILSSWIRANNDYVYLAGTSMAAPHVAGAAALLLSANPNMTPAQVQDAITNGAVNNGVHYPKTGSPNKLLDIQGTTGLSTPRTLLSHANNRYVTAEAGGSKPLIANRMGAGAWEDFDQIDQGGGFVAFKSRANGKFVTAESGGAAPLVASRTSVGAWEKFQLVPQGGNTFAIKANANGKFVTAEAGGAKALIARSTSVGLWEKFDDIVPAGVVSLFAGGGTVGGLQGAFVTAEAAGTKSLVANRDLPGAWEQFEIVDQGDGTIALRSQANGLFVTAEAGGAAPLIARSGFVGAWQLFKIDFTNDGSVFLLALANNRFVSANGTSPLIANLTDPNPASPSANPVGEYVRIVDFNDPTP